jgi:hypothetical protein
MAQTGIKLDELKKRLERHYLDAAAIPYVRAHMKAMFDALSPASRSDC